MRRIDVLGTESTTSNKFHEKHFRKVKLSLGPFTTTDTEILAMSETFKESHDVHNLYWHEIMICSRYTNTTSTT